MENIWDAHSHLSFLKMELVQQYVVEGIQKGMTKWMLGGYDSTDWQRQQILRDNLPESFTTSFGLHPWRVHELSEEEIEKELYLLEQRIGEANLVGEIGLDFHITLNDAQKKKQQLVFVKQLEMGYGRPFVFHIVQAHGVAIKTLRPLKKMQGIVHRFTGSLESAQEYAKLGLFVSIGPDILRSGADSLKMVVKEIPLESLVVESDSPTSLKDEGNPVDTFFKVAEEVAKCKGLGVEELLKATSANCESLIK